MSSIIPFDNTSKLPAYLVANRNASINREVLTTVGANFPTLSIKGKVFTLVKGQERKLLTRIDTDGEEEAVQSLQLTIARANTKSRVFYAKAYSEEDSAGAKPQCFSHDGVSPDVKSTDPQAKKCQGCAQNVWGVRDGKGTACSVNTRLAVIDPVNLGEPYLLRVPAASRKSFAAAVEAAEARGIDYNALVMRVSFDKEAPSPKLVFKPTGWLDDTTYKFVSSLYEDETVKEIVGVHEVATAAPEVNTDELDAAIATRAVVKAAAAKPVAAPKPAPVPEVSEDDIEEVVAKPAKVEAAKPAAKPAVKAKPTPVAPSDDGDDLLADMDALLSGSDD